MMAAIRKMLRALPKIFGGGRRADEMRHEREMAELDALQHGRVTPGYALRYAAVLIFVLAAVAVLVEACWPDVMPGSPVEGLEHLVDLGAGLLQRLFGM